MYQVSNDYFNSIYEITPKRRTIEGMIGDIEFTADDILKSSFTYKANIVSSSDIKLGGVFVSSISFSFLKPFLNNLRKGSVKGKKISINIGTWINNKYEFVPLGEFYVDSAEYSAVGMDITAYSAMSKLDNKKNLNSALNGKAYDIAVKACKNSGISFGMTKEEVQALPNGNINLGLYTESDVETWRDVISWLAVTLGGYAMINRQGQLIFKTWNDNSLYTITDDMRFNDGKFSDFETYYTGLSVVNIKEQKTEYYGDTSDDGLTMNLGSNPFMQYGTEETRETMKRNILNALRKFKYIPYSVSTYTDIAFDLGDVFTFTGGRANNFKCCIMGIEYKFEKGLKFQGYGKNPALANAKSKTDHNISGLMNQGRNNEVVENSFVNPFDIELLNKAEVEILNLQFASGSGRIVNFFAEINLDITGIDKTKPYEAEVKYYINGELLGYKPKNSWNNDGFHLMHLMYFIRGIEDNQTYSLQVTIQLTNCKADIMAGDIIASLQGQGLIAVEEWDGSIVASDIYEPIKPIIKLAELYEDCDVDLGKTMELEGTEIYIPIPNRTKISGIYDNDSEVHIIMQTGVYARRLEDGTIRRTEDGRTRLTKGGYDDA